MKLLNLILYSENIPEYIKMKNLLQTYLSKLHNFIYYFYTFNPLLSSDYEIKNNTIYIKGTDTFIPGVLEKTIKVLAICNKIHPEYDYIVRTNISTIINYPLLQNFLLVNKENNTEYIDYIGPSKILTWCDIPCGIINNKYYKIEFVCGICIILSKKCVNLILSNKEEIDYTVIDDVALGVFFDKHKIYPYNITSKSIENSRKFYHSKLIFRNKTDNRSDDIVTMNIHITNLIHNLQSQNML